MRSAKAALNNFLFTILEYSLISTYMGQQSIAGFLRLQTIRKLQRIHFDMWHLHIEAKSAKYSNIHFVCEHMAGLE